MNILNQIVSNFKQILKEARCENRVILVFRNLLSLTLIIILASNIKAQRIPCVDPIPEEPTKIFWSFNAQADIVPESSILDCSMIPIGSPHVTGYEIWRDPNNMYKDQPSYHFKMESDKQRRIELQSLFVTQDDLDKAGLSEQEIVDFQSTLSLYHFGKGEAKKGETWVYEYGLFLPKSLQEMTGIITQWHGMPDRTTIAIPDGNGSHSDTVTYDHKTFIDEILSQMYFKKEKGYDRITDEPNGYTRDYGGYPPMALRVRNGYLYLIARHDHLRLTDDTGNDRLHIYPPNNFPTERLSPKGNKTAYGLWSKLLTELPVEEWIDMKFVVRWSKFAEDGSGVLDEGSVKMYMNGELMADWTGFLGNNDKHGSYFKYGLYVPAENGLEVRLGGFIQYQVDDDGNPIIPEPPLAVRLTDSKTKKINVYPNPATDNLSIDIPEGSAILSVSIYDVNGKLELFHNGDSLNIDRDRANLNIKELDQGMYLISIIDQHKNEFGGKFIKE